MKRILWLLLPSIIIYTLANIYKERTKEISSSVQTQVCVKTVGTKLENIFKEDTEEKTKLYCECISQALTTKQATVITDIGISDLANPKAALEKIKKLTNKEDIAKLASDCLAEVQENFSSAETQYEEEDDEFKNNNED